MVGAMLEAPHSLLLKKFQRPLEIWSTSILQSDSYPSSFFAENYWFSASSPVRSWPRFVSLDYFKQPYYGLLVFDSCTIEAEVTVHGMADAL